ncbi:MAG: nucleotidyltransferase domain-containing protein [Candidatus Bathycorpusculaceae bacterium]
MLKLCRVNIERSEEIFKKIEAYVQEVIRNINPHLIVLFGSFATNNINEGSDVDILVVADFQESFLDRIAKLMNMNKFGIPIEPVGYTLEEFRNMKRRKNAFILEATEKGKVMYNRLPF